MNFVFMVQRCGPRFTETLRVALYLTLLTASSSFFYRVTWVRGSLYQPCATRLLSFGVPPCLC